MNNNDIQRYYNNYTKFPFALIIIIIYFALGFYLNSWHPLWIILLLIPILEGAIAAIKHQNLNRFPYPILVTLYYLFEGFYFQLWSPTWIIFFTIPIYYFLVYYFQNRRKK